MVMFKEDFEFFWDFASPYWAGEILNRWWTQTLRAACGELFSF
jgi:hypothetical protein